MNNETNNKLDIALKKFQLWVLTAFSTVILLTVFFVILIIKMEVIPSAELVVLQASEEEESEKLVELQKEHESLSNSNEYAAAIEAKENAVLAAGEEEEKVEQQVAVEKENVALQIEEQATITLAKLTAEQDEVEQITWYQDPSSPVYVNETGVYLSFGMEEGGRPAMDLHIQYDYDDTWLFIDSFRISADDNNYVIDPGYSRIHRDNSADSRWEWYVLRAEETDLLMIATMANSNTTIVRLNGDDYYHDIELSSQQKAAMKNVLDAYYAQVAKYEMEY